jgi:hypothetical protein
MPKSCRHLALQFDFCSRTKEIMLILSEIIGFYVSLATLSCPVMSDSVVDIKLDLSRRAEVSQEQPDWISGEVWTRHCLHHHVVVTGGSVFLRIMARQSSNSRQVTLFLKNESAQPMTVRLLSPGAAWKFTGWGRQVDAEEADAGFIWRTEPSMPLPLPREMVLEPSRLTMAQITDLTPVTAQPDDGQY